jgi:hypothetical protein
MSILERATLRMNSPAEVSSSQTINKRQFNSYNVLMVTVMSLGTLSYGYSTAVIGPTLGWHNFPSKDGTVSNHFTAQPAFIEYYNLATRKHATALISTITVGMISSEMVVLAHSILGALLHGRLSSLLHCSVRCR